MKFCPECGSNFEEGKTTCEICGYGKSKEEQEEIRNKNKFLFKEPGFDVINNSDFVPMLGVVPLEELKRRKLDYGNIITLSYTSSGGMEGRFYLEHINFDNKELMVEDKPFYNYPSTIKNYKVIDKDLEEIKKIIIENNMFAWSEVPIDRRFIAYDAPTNNMNIRTDNYNFTISYNIYMDDEENKIFNELRGLVHSLIKDENLISEKNINNPSLGLLSNDDVNKIKDMKINYCPECGGIIEENNKFCPNCGYKKGE